MSERLIEIGDIASQLTENMNNRALQEQQRRTLHTMSASNIMNCVECGIDIPKARKAAAPWAIRCADCQNDHEATKGKL